MVPSHMGIACDESLVHHVKEVRKFIGERRLSKSSVGRSRHETQLFVDAQVFALADLVCACKPVKGVDRALDLRKEYTAVEHVSTIIFLNSLLDNAISPAL